MTTNNSVVELERVMRNWATSFDKGYTIYETDSTYKFQIHWDNKESFYKKISWVNQYIKSDNKSKKISVSTYNFEDKDSLHKFLTFYNLRWQM
jgi:hypothetical protein